MKLIENSEVEKSFLKDVISSKIVDDKLRLVINTILTNLKDEQLLRMAIVTYMREEYIEYCKNNIK